MQSSDNKFVVEELVLSDHQTQELNSILKKSTAQTKSKRGHIRNLLGGVCSACWDIPPTKKVSYDVGDNSKLVIYFCSDCYDKNKNDLNKRLENMNFT